MSFIIVYVGSCSARCAYPTMGDFKASATAAHVGRGSPLFNQSLIMAVTHSSGSPLAAFFMESNVPGEVPTCNPMLYHFDLASQTAFRTLTRSLIPRIPKMETMVIIILPYSCIIMQKLLTSCLTCTRAWMS